MKSKYVDFAAVTNSESLMTVAFKKGANSSDGRTKLSFANSSHRR
ncbi:hypothetical protein [Actinoplanes sp. NPDC048796]